jgi:DNA-binding Lrp family transcriptional regulator
MVAISSKTREILRELCMNSRITITELSEKLSISRSAVSKRISALEEELGLRYTIDIERRALGFGTFVIYYLSFKKKPPEKVVKSWLEKSEMVQLAVKTSGNFDLVLFVLPIDDEKFAKWNLGIGLEFSDYGVSVNKSDMDIIHHGFVPLNDSIIMDAKIDEVYRKLLVELNKNSRASIRELSKKLELNEEMVRYYLSKLVKTDIIKRFTAVITKPPQSVSLMMFFKYVYRPGAIDRINEKRKVYFKKELEPPVFNDWQMVSSTSGSSDEFEWAMAETQKQAIDERLGLHRRIFSKDEPDIKYGAVVDIMKGTLAIRNVDIKQLYIKTEWQPGKNYVGGVS